MGRGKQFWLVRTLRTIKGLDREVCHAADVTSDFVGGVVAGQIKLASLSWGIQRLQHLPES